jgi:hypothetical protein
MIKEKYTGESRDFRRLLWATGFFTLLGFYLLGQYFNDIKLVVLAGTIILGVEYFNVKREYSSRS